MNEHEKVSYVEFPAKDLQATKNFFSEVFGWTFQDFGPTYISFSNVGIDGGFRESEQQSKLENGAALVIIYSKELEATQSKIEQAGGVIIVPIFSFPGGRRFHFTEPSGNELAVWSDTE